MYRIQIRSCDSLGRKMKWFTASQEFHYLDDAIECVRDNIKRGMCSQGFVRIIGNIDDSIPISVNF